MLSNRVKNNAVERDIVRLLASITILLAIPSGYSIIWLSQMDSNSAILLPAVFVLWLIGLWLMSKSFGLNLVIRCGLIAILEIVFLTFIANLFHDNSWDGNQYQSEGPLQIFLGWNPYQEIIAPAKWDTSWAVWLDSLPKFGWEISAFILHLGGSQASSKILSLIGLLLIAKTSCLLASSFALRRSKRVLIILTSLSFPIGVAQFPTSYQDGFSASWTISLILVVFMSQKIRENGFNVWPIVATLSVGAFISKYSQIIPVIMALVGYFVFSEQMNDWFRRVVTIFSGVLFLGFNPYITNILSFGNPLYPMRSVNYVKQFGLGGQNITENTINANIQQNIYSSQTASNIIGDFQPIQFLESIFSRTAHVSSSIPAKLKIPGFFSRSEFEYMTNPDARIGGFGPLFSLVVVILIFGLLVKKNKFSSLTKYLIFGILMSVLVTPYPWWARYIGFLFSLLLILILIFIVSESRKIGGVAITAGCLLILQALTLSYGHVMKEYSYQRPIYSVTNPSQISIELRDQAFSGFRLDWAKGSPFVYENIEVDFFLNHIKPTLTYDEIELMKSCYSQESSLASWGHPLKRHVDDEFFNSSGLLKIKESCNFNSLATVQNQWAEIPFQRERILN